MANTQKRFGVMLDMSRNAVMRPAELKKFAKLLRSFGYNMLQLYTEDTYAVAGEPYFGYMRGRYTEEELSDVVEYCASIGVEVIPLHTDACASQSDLPPWRIQKGAGHRRHPACGRGAYIRADRAAQEIRKDRNGKRADPVSRSRKMWSTE